MSATASKSIKLSHDLNKSLSKDFLEKHGKHITSSDNGCSVTLNDQHVEDFVGDLSREDKENTQTHAAVREAALKLSVHVRTVQFSRLLKKVGLPKNRPQSRDA